MAIAVNPNEPFDYVLKEDRELPPEEQTIFHLRPLKHHERVKLDDMRYGMNARTSTVETPQGQIADLTLKVGLQGWKNLRDGNGGDVPFEQNPKTLNLLGTNLRPPTDECLGRLHPNHVDELVEAIRDVNRLTDEEGKG